MKQPKVQLKTMLSCTLLEQFDAQCMKQGIIVISWVMDLGIKDNGNCGDYAAIVLKLRNTKEERQHRDYARPAIFLVSGD